MLGNRLNVVTPLHTNSGKRLADLRLLLAEKFPAAPLHRGGVIATGIESIDRADGGLRLGAMTEISGTPAGNSLLLASLLSMLATDKRLGALVDCGSCFDPCSFCTQALQRLLWVRCALPAEAVKAADLLLRDGNLSLLVIDLQSVGSAAGHKIPASTWHRFQRVVEQGNMALAVLTPRPLVEGASVRIAVNWHWNFEAIANRRKQLLANVDARISSRRALVSADVLHLRTA